MTQNGPLPLFDPHLSRFGVYRARPNGQMAAVILTLRLESSLFRGGFTCRLQKNETPNPDPHPRFSPPFGRHRVE
jgi:hypothetical protein